MCLCVCVWGGGHRNESADQWLFTVNPDREEDEEKEFSD